MNGKNIRGLAKIVEIVYEKKLSKYNQESAWDQRPLRAGQIHYGALDAVSVLDILMKVREKGGDLAEKVSNFSITLARLKEKTTANSRMSPR